MGTALSYGPLPALPVVRRGAAYELSLAVGGLPLDPTAATITAELVRGFTGEVYGPLAGALEASAAVGDHYSATVGVAPGQITTAIRPGIYFLRFAIAYEEDGDPVIVPPGGAYNVAIT